MNKAYSLKRNAVGQTVVCSEKARSHSKMKTVALAVAMATGTVSVPAFADVVGILGTPTGANSVAIGQDSWATSTSGVATGHESVATGVDITRAEFDALAAKHAAALDAYKKAQDAVVFAGNDVKANATAVEGLAKEIADLEEKQRAAADKIAQLDRLNAQKQPLDTRLTPAQDALDKATAALKEVQDEKGRNLFLNFTDVLNSLNWTPLTQGGDSNANRNTVAAELKQKVETTHPEFSTKYDQQKYRDIVDGFINRQASYQGSVEGITAQLGGTYLQGRHSKSYTNPLLNQVYYALPKTTAEKTVTIDDLTDVPANIFENVFATFFSIQKINTPSTSMINPYVYSHLNPSITLDSIESYTNRIKLLSVDQQEQIQKAYNNLVRHGELIKRNDNPYVVNKNTEFNGIHLRDERNAPLPVKDFRDDFNKRAVLHSLMVTTPFYVKTTDNNYHNITTPDARLIYTVEKLKDFSVNNTALITSKDITDYRGYFEGIQKIMNETDWSDPNAAYNMVDLKQQFTKTYNYAKNVNDMLNLYEEVINEAKKPNADKNVIDAKTQQIIGLKAVVVDGAYDVANYSVGITPILSAKGQEYLKAGDATADAIISRINSELKLYNDKDELIVEATAKSKDLQDKYDAAKRAVDDLNRQIAAVDAEIKKIGLTPDEINANNIKAEKQKELDDANARKAELEKALADKTKAMEDARKALEGSGITAGNRNLAAGYDAFASGNDSIAVGTNSTVTRDSGIAIGKNATVTGVKSIALGSDNQVTGANSVALGVKNSIASDDVMVLGNNITVPTGKNGSVVLGSDSTVGTASPTANIEIRGTTYNFAGATPTSTVSVGAAGKERQIVNVAAGRVVANSTDAINGSQLYAVTDALANLKVSTKTSSVVSQTPNIVVTPKVDGENTEYQLNMASNLTGVDKVGNTGSSFTFSPNAINAGGANITNLKNPVNATDAATKQYVDSMQTGVEGGTGITVTSKPKQGGGTTYTVSVSDDLAKQIAKEESVSAGKNIIVKQDKANATGGKNYEVSLSGDLTDINSITNAGKPISFGGSRLSNIGAPVDANDATTKQYVDDTRTTVTSRNGSVTVTKNGYNYDLASNHTTKVSDGKGGIITLKHNDTLGVVAGSDAVTSTVQGNNIAVDLSAKTKGRLDQLEKGLNTKTDDGKVVNRKAGDTVAINGGKNITTSTNADGSVIVGLNDNIGVNSVSINGTTVGMGANGINAGGKVIEGVADGRISPDSKQAINGSQLNAAYNYIDNSIHNVRMHVNDVEDKLEAGLAGNNAAASLPQVTMLGKSMLSVAAGGYADKGAVAVGYSRLSDSGRTTLKTHINANTEKKVGYGVGLGYTW